MLVEDVDGGVITNFVLSASRSRCVRVSCRSLMLCMNVFVIVVSSW